MHTKDLISHCVHEISIRGAQKLHLRFQSLYKQYYLLLLLLTFHKLMRTYKNFIDAQSNQ